MYKGITKFQIGDVLKNLNNEDINNNFVCIFSANQMNRFIDYKAMISKKKSSHPFNITNTDSSDKSHTHGWRIMDIEAQAEFCYFF